MKILYSLFHPTSLSASALKQQKEQQRNTITDNIENAQISGFFILLLIYFDFISDKFFPIKNASPQLTKRNSIEKPLGMSSVIKNKVLWMLMLPSKFYITCLFNVFKFVCNKKLAIRVQLTPKKQNSFLEIKFWKIRSSSKESSDDLVGYFFDHIVLIFLFNCFPAVFFAKFLGR